jgi:AP-3 complex subunit delta-1
LAPAFFDLLTNTNNNWMLIKVVKLLCSLVSEEPRLARKLLDPLAGIVRNTPAKSLLFEAAYAVTKCLPYSRKSDGSMPSNVPSIVDLCSKTFMEFVEEKDQNLKYLGLVGFGSLIQTAPKILSNPSYRPLILACLSDEDVTIRSRALSLLPSMASRNNLMELVTQLLKHVAFASGTYKQNLVAKVVEMCSGEKYTLLQDFRWYLDTLFKLGQNRGLEVHGKLLQSQVCDVALRVLPVRAYAVKRSIEVLLKRNSENNNHDYDSSNVGNNGRGELVLPEMLPTLAWIVGEYSDLLPEAMIMDSDAVYIYNEDSEGPYHSIIQAITAPSNESKLPVSVQSAYLQASLKVFAAACANQQVSDSEMEACLHTVFYNLGVFTESPDVEVCERASTLKGLLIALKLVPEFKESATPFNPLENLKGKSGTSMAFQCRNASPTLNYLLKPSPMKPTGAKAQRKKQQSPVGTSGF